jgi:glycosyltransferase involved in cell wall biosynthesis
MSCVVNGRFLSRQVTGVERYAGEILRCLGEKPRIVQPRRALQGAGGHFWEQIILPGYVQPPDRLWSPANTGPLRVTNQVLTLHDLSPLEHPEWFAPAFSLWYRLFIPILVRRVRCVVVSSAYMKKKIELRFTLSPKRVSVVPGGVDLNRFRPGLNPPEGIPARYLLYVGTLQPRKNLPDLLQAWNQVSQQFPDAWLLLAGGIDRNLSRIVLNMPLDRVHFLGYVPDRDLAGLYAGAQASVIPSLEEGFGLPVLEAMACGIPVIASNAGSLPEVIGDAGILFDLNRPAELASQLQSCLSDADFRYYFTEKGLRRVKDFSWEASAKKIREVLQA